MRRLVWVSLAVGLVVLGLGGAWSWRSVRKSGSRLPPGAGSVVPMAPEDVARLAEVWEGRSGFVVWSSTLFGNHELVRLDWPSGKLSRLTEHPHADRSPRISPDGGRVAFARSREPWVSFRNWLDWDVWVLELSSGEERRLAEFGAEPVWSGDGAEVVFQRGGRQVVAVNVADGGERVVLGESSGSGWTGPSMDPRGEWLAVTVRGGRRSTSLVSLADGRERRVAGGCQLTFVPGGDWLVLVEGGGEMKNRICRVERDGGGLRTLLDMPPPWSHEYFPRVSNDGALLVFGASRGEHEHDTADYEIFVWRMGRPAASAARVSFHTGNDHDPDIWVSGAD